MAKPVKKTKTTTAPKMIRAVESENEFFSAFDKLVKGAEKNTAALNKIIDTIKAQLKKAGDKKETAKDKRVALVAKVKTKPAKAAESQLEKAKAAYEIANQAVEALQAKHQAMQSQLKSAKLFQQKLAALSQEIDTFNKAWEKKQATTKAEKKKKPKKKETTKIASKKGKGKKKTAQQPASETKAVINKPEEKKSAD